MYIFTYFRNDFSNSVHLYFLEFLNAFNFENIFLKSLGKKFFDISHAFSDREKSVNVLDVNLCSGPPGMQDYLSRL